MSVILVYVEAHDGTVSAGSLETLAGARQLADAAGGSVEALVLAADPAPIASQVVGADRVLTVSHPALAQYLPEAHQAVLVETVKSRKPDLVLLTNSYIGLDLAASTAIATDRPVVSYCMAVSLAGDLLTTTNQVYGGKIEAVAETRLPAVAAVNPGTFKGEAAAKAAETVVLPPPAALGSLGTGFVEALKEESGDVDITQQERLVSVGRGIGDAANIEIAEALATALGAVVSASRPVVDAGWMPKSRQVGKSGHKVKPKLYVAVGISGAPEHLEGMRDAGFIVAVNQDAKAPIFDVAHIGTTCDLFDLLPALTERLNTRNA
ncbi:MAG TPA: electron transfer flavoprotein subunit alpha/FixB family protein [Hypericibacter adhaerens]|jgi:electron transfer flavoprotein alpha subunit|uniref:Electron transfer flavoprotein subunit alpha n=1 Tax=Hypericibacter adhaerens TaxID=2602016 RepID=A0A5J6MYW4_9PROT|nr:electron transfer flavoprotein subunit alpha/FixB family protein [Hypericibacter adhaerens]QEX21775.1 electron transfer flavoprotein subunit alpha [Hypericibacter adhaerens]HWA42423.1 electron transfer flavoprotein subunit alpha/FixB family protein [Hypericibacter adhaerens]